MAEVDVNATGLAVGFQSAINVDPTAWWTQEPNSYGDLGATLKMLAREPISINNQREEGGVVGLDSAASFECDLTREAMLVWLTAIMFANSAGPANFRVTGVTATGYTVASGGAIAADLLIFASGFTNAANNGFKLVTAGSTATEIKASGLVAETISNADQRNARVEICGVQATSGDVVVASATQITSTALNWTSATYGLTVGQYVWVGGDAAGTRFATAADRGSIRLTSIAAGAITFDEALTTWVADTGVGKTIQIFFGKFWRNVSVLHAAYNKQYATLEHLLDNLDAGADVFEYPKNNLVAGCELPFTPESKVTMKLDIVGTDTPVGTTSRKSGAVDQAQVNLGEMYDTSSDVFRLRLADSAGVALATADDDHESFTIKIARKVTAKKVVKRLGASKLLIGKFLGNVTMKNLLTTLSLLQAIRNSTEVRFNVGIRNTNGAIVYDFPKGKLGGGGKEYAADDAVMVNLDFEAQRSLTFNYTLGVSMFPYLPAAT